MTSLVSDRASHCNAYFSFTVTSATLATAKVRQAHALVMHVLPTVYPAYVGRVDAQHTPDQHSMPVHNIILYLASCHDRIDYAGCLGQPWCVKGALW